MNPISQPRGSKIVNPVLHRVVRQWGVAFMFFCCVQGVGGQDQDADGMTDLYEDFFWLNSSDPTDAVQDPDGDSLNNLAESLLWTDPFESDTDLDGWPDAADSDPLSRAVIFWGNEKFTLGDAYFYTGPDWWLGAGKQGGEWTNASWYVAASDTGVVRRLYLDLASSINSSAVRMDLTMFDHGDSALYLDLYDTNDIVIVTNQFGNLLGGSEQIIALSLNIPIFTNLPVNRLMLRRGKGEISMYSSILYVDEDWDGLDREQEQQLGTSDTHPDTDGDGMPDGWESMHQLNPLLDDSSADPDGDGIPNLDEYLEESDPNTASYYDYGRPGYLWREQWNGITGPSVNHFFLQSSFTNPPSASGYSAGAEGPRNIGDNYFARYRGSLTPPESGYYRLYIASDDASKLFLSTNGSADHATMIAEVPNSGYTSFRQWNKYTQQRSVSIYLQAGERYYLAVYHKEGSGGDHVSLAWKPTSAPDSAIQVIAAQYIRSLEVNPYDRDEDGMPDAWEMVYGLDPLVNDAFGDLDGDGITNIDEYLEGSDPSLIAFLDGGRLGYLLREHWNNVSGDQVQNFFDSGAWRILPNIINYNAGAEGPSSAGDNYFTRYRGYIVPPQTGDYRFYIAADNGADFYVSIDDHPREKVLVAQVPGNGYTAVRQWNKFQEQASTPIPLQAGNRYYLEVHHKEKDGFDHLSLGWMPPWTNAISVISATHLVSCTGDPNDLDRDGLPDDWEEANGTSLLWDDATEDDDGDRLSNLYEYQLGTHPQETDSDADGFSDWVEVNHIGSDPAVGNFTPVFIASVAATNTSGQVGSWGEYDDSLYSTDWGGELSYAFALPSAGFYVLEVGVSQFDPYASFAEIPLSVTVNGRHLYEETHHPEFGVIQTYRWMFFTSDTTLDALLAWRFRPGSGSIHVHDVRLLTLDGEDADLNGIADWLEHRSTVAMSVDAMPSETWGSPYCMEGTALRFEHVLVSSEYAQAEFLPQPAVRRGAGKSWFADVDLSPTNSTQWTVQYASETEIISNSMNWVLFDLVDPATNALTLRKGDSLLLGGAPTGATNGVLDITIVGVTNYSGGVDIAIPHAFTVPGTNRIEAVWTGDIVISNQIDVRVVEGSFNGNPRVWPGRTRTWDNPDLPRDAYIEVDQDVHIMTTTNGTTGLKLFMNQEILGTQGIVARLGKDLSILDAAEIKGIDLDSTGLELSRIHTWADGTALVRMTVKVTDLYDGMKIKLKIFTGDIYFADGSTLMYLYKSDFNALGEATVYFIIGPEKEGGICHYLEVYQKDELVGRR